MKKIIEIPAGYELIQEGNTYRIVEKKNPMELLWELAKVEMQGDNELASKYQLFIRLVETCKEWNRIAGFEADWGGGFAKYVIKFFDNEIYTDVSLYNSFPLHFKNIETAELFLYTFRDEIELVKDLI
jgi:hypothetical protein